MEGVPSKAVDWKVLGPNSPTTGEPSMGGGELNGFDGVYSGTSRTITTRGACKAAPPGTSIVM